jgi:hypothetical protein
MNKNYIIGSIALLAVAAIAAINVTVNSQKNNELSAVSLANVEALASCEIVDWVGNGWYITFWDMCSWSCSQGGMFRCPI